MSDDKIPRGLRSLSVPPLSSSKSYGQQLKAEAAALDRWWASPRWMHTARVYSGKYPSFPFL